MFLVCGEALFDMFLRTSPSGELSLDAIPGGSPFNVALGLARLGQKAEFFSGLSSDLMGRKLMGFMEKERIGIAYAIPSAAPTALSIVELDEHGSPDYSFYGDFPAYRTITQADLPMLASDIRAVHFGSIATILEPTASTLAALAERENEHRLIAYDPNLRPSIEPDLDVWRRAFQRLSGAAHLIKVSADDLALLYPGTVPEAIARGWLARAARLVVITRGAQGAQAWTSAAHAECAGRPVEVVDAVGAGDSFQSALLAGLAEMDCLTPEAIDRLSAEQLHRLLSFAVEAAAISCSRRGADLPHRSEIATDLALSPTP